MDKIYALSRSILGLAIIIIAFLLTPNTLQAQFWNFDAVPNGSVGALNNGWTGDALTGYRWEAHAGPTGSAGTGPDVDHTLGSATGIFMYVEASTPAVAGDTCLLTSPNIDLTSFANPGLEFWYHKAGNAMGDLYIDVYNGSSWIRDVDSIIGSVQSNPADPWLSKTVNLGNFSDTIQVRFRAHFGTSWAGDMAIDDVNIINVPAYDLELSNAGSSPAGYSIWPTSQFSSIVFSGLISNIGADTLTNVTLRVSSGAYLDSASTAQLLPSATAPLTMPTGYSAALGTHLVSFDAYATEGDANLLNNSASMAFEVSDSVYARDDGLQTGSLGIGAANNGILGQTFEITTTDTMTTVSFLLNAPTIGDSVYVTLHSFDTIPGAVLATTELLLVPSTSPAWYTLKFDCPPIVTPDNYFIGVHESVANNVTLGTTPFNYQPNTGWVIFGANPWNTSESYGFQVTYLLRPNFGEYLPAQPAALADMELCPGDSVTWDAGTWASVAWNGSGTSPTYTTGVAGTFSVEMTHADGCVFLDTVVATAAVLANAGTSAANTMCTNLPGADLTMILGGSPDAGGTWTDVNASGALTGNIFDPAVAGTGTWNFIYNVSDNCGGDTSSVVMTVIPAVSAGTGSSFSIGDCDAAINLNDSLTNQDGGGIWIDSDGSGALAGSVFTPSNTNAGTYNMLYVVGNNCGTDTSTIVVTVLPCINVTGALSLDMEIFPNPSQGVFSVKVPEFAGFDWEVRVFNLVGQQVFQANSQGSQQIQIDLEEAKAGVYMLEVSKGSEAARTQIIIQ